MPEDNCRGTTYNFVNVEGPVISVEPFVMERDERSMALRYLGRELAGVYRQAIKADPANGPDIVVRMRPEEWLASDFAKQFGTPPKR